MAFKTSQTLNPASPLQGSSPSQTEPKQEWEDRDVAYNHCYLIQ